MKFFLLLVFGLLFAGCTNVANNPPTSITPSPTVLQSTPVSVQPAGAKIGDSVSVDYVGSLTDGKVFDTSLKEEAQKAGLPLRPTYSPLSFTVGAGQMIKGFDAAVVGMVVGQEKTVTLLPSEAYGEKKQDRVAAVPLEDLTKAGLNATVGTKLVASNGMRGTITLVNATHATVDFNHDLAGKTLVFKIIMRKIG